MMHAGRVSFVFRAVVLTCFGAITGEGLAAMTVINSPPSPSPTSVGADTQFNLFAGGNVANDFKALAGSEVNIVGGTIGSGFTAYSGSMINVSGGTFRTRFTVEGAANVTGGSFDCCFRVLEGGVVNFSGGSITNALHVFSGGTLHVSGGSIGHEFRSLGNSNVTISGGSLGNGFNMPYSSRLEILGGDYRLDGVPISGLHAVGDSRQFNVPAGAVLSGTFADGSPFAFSTTDHDDIEEGSLTLKVVPLPAYVPTTFTIPTLVPRGLRAGQTLRVTGRNVVRDHFNADVGSTVEISGGRIGTNFEAVGAQVAISGGIVGTYFAAFHGTTVDISGGTIDINFEAFPGSVVNITNGVVGDFFRAHDRSRIHISGGAVGKGFRAFSGSHVRITGGFVGDEFNAYEDSHVDISGGSVGANFQSYDSSEVTISGGTIGKGFRAPPGSTVHVLGKQFALDGIDIGPLLTRGIPFAIEPRNVNLEGILRDGSPFHFDLNSQFVYGEDYFAPTALLMLTFVPEPTTAALQLMAVVLLPVSRRSRW